MIDTVPQPDASLPQFLAARARHASDGVLAADVIAGLALLLLSTWWRGPLWYLGVAVGACVLSFGAWGVTDRELAEHPNAPGTRGARVVRRTLVILRLLSGVAGALATVFILLALLGIALGTIIS